MSRRTTHQSVFRQRIARLAVRFRALACGLLAGAVLSPASAFGASLTALPTQDLNGKSGDVVEQQTAEYVDVKAYENSHANNRKALFLFDLASFAGRNVTDQCALRLLLSVGVG